MQLLLRWESLIQAGVARLTCSLVEVVWILSVIQPGLWACSQTTETTHHAQQTSSAAAPLLFILHFFLPSALCCSVTFFFVLYSITRFRFIFQKPLSKNNLSELIVFWYDIWCKMKIFKVVNLDIRHGVISSDFGATNILLIMIILCKTEW